MAQLQNLSERGGYAMEECCHVDLDQAMDLPELDGALLMELMEDLPPSDLVDDGDRLSNVIRSLEAEIIDDGEAAEAIMVDDELAIRVPADSGGRLEDMLSELDEYEGGSLFTCWPDEVSLVEGQLDVDGWYTYVDGNECGVAVHEPADHHHRYYYAESSAEQVYIPLWE